jgi:hypothetical protein
MSDKPPIVQIECAGKGIASDSAMPRIVASGTNPRDVRDATIKAGEPKPVLGSSRPAKVAISLHCVRH